MGNQALSAVIDGLKLLPFQGDLSARFLASIFMADRETRNIQPAVGNGPGDEESTNVFLYKRLRPFSGLAVKYS